MVVNNMTQIHCVIWILCKFHGKLTAPVQQLDYKSSYFKSHFSHLKIISQLCRKFLSLSE